MEPTNKDILDAIQGIQSNIGSIQSDISSMKGDISSMQSDIGSMKEEMHAMKSDIQEIKSDLKETNERVDEVLEAVGAFSNHVEERFDGVVTTVEFHRGMNQLEDRLVDKTTQAKHVAVSTVNLLAKKELITASEAQTVLA